MPAARVIVTEVSQVALDSPGRGGFRAPLRFAVQAHLGTPLISCAVQGLGRRCIRARLSVGDPLMSYSEFEKQTLARMVPELQLAGAADRPPREDMSSRHREFCARSWPLATYSPPLIWFRCSRTAAFTCPANKFSAGVTTTTQH